MFIKYIKGVRKNAKVKNKQRLAKKTRIRTKTTKGGILECR